jgi:hypothetical protein
MRQALCEAWTTTGPMLREVLYTVIFAELLCLVFFNLRLAEI